MNAARDALAFAAQILADPNAWHRGRESAVDQSGRAIHPLAKDAQARSLRGALELAVAQGFRGKLKVRAREPDKIEFDAPETADAFFAVLHCVESAFGWRFDFVDFNQDTLHGGLMRKLEAAARRLKHGVAND